MCEETALYPFETELVCLMGKKTHKKTQHWVHGLSATMAKKAHGITAT